MSHTWSDERTPQFVMLQSLESAIKGVNFIHYRMTLDETSAMTNYIEKEQLMQ